MFVKLDSKSPHGNRPVVGTSLRQPETLFGAESQPLSRGESQAALRGPHPYQQKMSRADRDGSVGGDELKSSEDGLSITPFSPNAI